jgi:hypothetical protein
MMATLVRSATLEIPNIGRVRPDLPEMMVRAAMDGVGTAVANEGDHKPTNEQFELCGRIEPFVRAAIVAVLECPTNPWQDRAAKVIPHA